MAGTSASAPRVASDSLTPNSRAIDWRPPACARMSVICIFCLLRRSDQPSLTLSDLPGFNECVPLPHNAEFIYDYPNLPAAWLRADVYMAWLAMTSPRLPDGRFSAHTLAMNATILAEVTAAALVLIEVVRQIAPTRSSKDPARACRPPPIARDTRRSP